MKCNHTRRVTGSIAAAATASLQSVGIRLPGVDASAPASGGTASTSGTQQHFNLPGSGVLQQGLIPSLRMPPHFPAVEPSPSSSPPAAAASKQKAPGGQAGDDREVARAVLRQQRQIERLRRQNRALRAAVCEVDPKASVCKSKGAGGGWDDGSSEF
jgi:hypothetical protein